MLTVIYSLINHSENLHEEKKHMSNDCWHLIAGGKIYGTINIIYKMLNFVMEN